MRIPAARNAIDFATRNTATSALRDRATSLAHAASVAKGSATAQTYATATGTITASQRLVSSIVTPSASDGSGFPSSRTTRNITAQFASTAAVKILPSAKETTRATRRVIREDEKSTSNSTRVNPRRRLVLLRCEGVVPPRVRGVVEFGPRPARGVVVIAAMTRRRSPGSAGRSSRPMAGVETTPRTGEAVESEESSSSLSSEESSSFAIAVVTGVTGVEIDVVASFAAVGVAAVAAAVLAAAVLAAAARCFLLAGPGANRRGSPASS
jgi:hypothetical protein